ncbi:DUF3455 domain-containing protein [Amycolatopsis pigmentata]|uniref:DUF3455 domain-containing protein n=1 Tax=Amycolatopsis pigmentata TaxID=450801 RepID=A0ABW5G1S3_9PSEU
MKKRKMLVGLLTAALATVAAAGTASAAHSDGPVPKEVQVPDGARQIVAMHGHGVQKYQCADGKWSLLEPDAILEEHGVAKILHTRGPVWTSVVDGSSVQAKAIGTSAVDNAIPQLLLQATSHSGAGLLADVGYIQRLHTSGGVAPTGSCTADQAPVSVPYQAEYVFWTDVTAPSGN